MGKLSLCIVFFLSLLASVTLAAYECGRQADGKICDKDYACCSQWGYCGFTYEYCSPKRNCQSNCIPFNEVVTNVTTYYSYLNQNNYTLVGVDCAPWFSNKSFEWRSRYEWTAFAASSVGLPLRAACGRCLKVTNLATGAQTTVRIVAAAGGLDLDVTPYKQIDTDGHGFIDGHLTVSYEFVLCGDEDELKLISMVV